jgi:hypothetical protein
MRVSALVSYNEKGKVIQDVWEHSAQEKYLSPKKE